jgi:hypothetical protein
VTIPAANFVTSDTKTGITFAARGPNRILADVSRAYGMQRQDYSKRGLFAYQNNEGSSLMFAACTEVQLSFLPLAKLRNERVGHNM